jgi:outer membrane protein assembly factor BamB
MRGAGRIGLLMVLVVAVGGCGEAPRGSATAKDLLYFEGPSGISVLAAGAGSEAPVTAGVPSSDWSSVVTADAYRIATHVEARDARSGESLWKQSIEGPKLDVRVVSRKAEMVALTPQGNHYSQGRTQTTLVVTGRDVPPRTIRLDGNYEPEAFSNDGGSVFVLQYLPATNPNSYRVRRLDLATEQVLGVYSVDAELQERMQGTARIQAMSPDGTYLYTLYTTGGEGHRRAFVHVLNLDRLWAHCIDLPAEFGQLREPEVALTVSPDSKRLYVNDVDSGAMAEVDTQSLEILQTSEAPVMTSGYSPRGVHDGDHTLYLARGPFLSAIDTETLKETQTWTMDVKIRGVQVSADASKVYVALMSKVVTLDARTGEELERTDPPGVGRIHRMGPVMRSIQTPLSKLTCAC